MKDRAKQLSLKNFLNNYLIIIGIAALTIYTCIVQPSFYSPTNLLALIRQYVPLGMVALGMTLIIISGYIDMSVAGIFSFMGILSAMLLNRFTPLALLLVLLLGIVCGGLDALIIVKCGAKNASDALFITYGLQVIFSSLALIVNKGNYVSLDQTVFTKYMGSGNLFGIPFMFICFMLVTALLQFIMKRMPIGRSVHLTGGNRVAAILCGIHTKKIIVFVFILTGVLTAFGSFISVCRIGSALPIAGRNYEANAIMAVTVGGTSLSGGKGSVLHTVFGVALITIMQNALNILGVSTNMQFVWRGLILIAAIWIDSRRKV